MDEEIKQALGVPELAYSRVWEDHRVLSKALAIQPTDTVLCITSSGDNVLNLLLDGPKEMVAVDLSQAQNSLLELKLAGIRCLSHHDFLVLFGETEDNSQRWDEIYAAVKENGNMSLYAKQYWDKHHKSLKSCGSWLGKFEKYILGFSRDHLRGVVSAEQVDEFFSALSLEEQRKIFDQWPLQKLREAYGEFLSTSSQTKGRSSAKLKFVQLSDTEIQDTTWVRLERACREVPVRDNFYLSWLLRGARGFDPLVKPEYAPPYLTREGFDKLKGLVDRVVVHNGAIEEYFTQTGWEKPSKLALSNIFEYMSQELADSVFDTLGSHLPSGGRVVYWEFMNSQAPSHSPPAGGGRARLLEMKDECQQLRREDRSTYFLLRVLHVKHECI